MHIIVRPSSAVGMNAGSELVATTAIATAKHTRIGASVIPRAVMRSQTRPAT